MIATSRFRISYHPVSYIKPKDLKHKTYDFYIVFYRGVKLGLTH
jgi:hypothetical protein